MCAQRPLEALFGERTAQGTLLSLSSAEHIPFRLLCTRQCPWFHDLKSPWRGISQGSVLAEWERLAGGS